jgi:hypothetical protein
MKGEQRTWRRKLKNASENVLLTLTLRRAAAPPSIIFYLMRLGHTEPQ